MIKIKVGDEVMWRDCWGSFPAVKATIESMELCERPRMKYGDAVDEVDIADRERTLFVLTNGKWAYGNQISKIIETPKWRVYHKINPDFRDIEGDVVSLSDFEYVAFVEFENIEGVFRLTNHIDRSWWENRDVTLIKQSRSTSVGDLILNVDSGKYFLCCCTGWKLVLASE